MSPSGDLRFDGRVVVVTGAGGNPSLGRAYAKLLASRGAKLVINDIGASGTAKGRSDNARAESVVQEILDDGGEAVADTHTVADPTGAELVVGTAVEAFGRVDALINNAGVCIWAWIDQVSTDDIRTQIDASLMGTIWMTRAVWPVMCGQNFGRIVNVTSGAMFGAPQLAAYGAAKGGAMALTKTIAMEGALHDIKCNAVSPTAGTRMAAVTLEEDSEFLQWMMSQPPELVAPIVALLAHDDCPVTGEVFSAGGGRVSRTQVTESAGWSDPAMTVESLRDNFAEVMDATRPPDPTARPSTVRPKPKAYHS